MDTKNETRRLLKRLRWMVQLSEATQHEIEVRAGFSRGYLSQMLNGHVEIKIWHLLTILDTIGVCPADLFFQLFPRRRSRVFEVLEAFRRSSQSFDRPLVTELARLYGFGIESLEDLEDRLDRCEDVLTMLDAWSDSSAKERPEREDPGLERSNRDDSKSRG